jgi:SAM-dependent methyltransferase
MPGSAESCASCPPLPGSWVSTMRTDANSIVDAYGRSPAAGDKPAYFRLHRGRYVALLGALEVPAGSRVLEIGCNPGQFTEILVQAGYRVSGIDLHPEDRPALWARLGVEVRRANLEEEAVPFGEASFDAVVFSEVLEHLSRSPLPALEEFWRVLAPQGTLVLSTPNARSIRERLLLGARLLFWQSLEPAAEFRHRMELRGEARYTVHQRLYTAAEVHWLLERVGFKAVRVRYALAREGVGVTGDRLLRKPWRVVPKALLWAVAALIPPARSTLLVTARKEVQAR